MQYALVINNAKINHSPVSMLSSPTNATRTRFEAESGGVSFGIELLTDFAEQVRLVVGIDFMAI